MLKWTDSR